ncbi:MAG TPA: AAA family ATPase, partial [Caulobacteraceae bacterium]|nr:AAA family ATPase [Caulobacteraceae bacterium]
MISLLERDEPRTRLEAALAAARSGRGRIVSLEGEAGIGKTSLAQAFIDAQRPHARIHVGGCEHLATPEPLGPLRDIARESQGRFAISPVGHLATFEALLRMLQGGRGPALLVIEDIHWADDATLDCLRFLGRRIRTAPVLVLVTFRSDEPDSRARLVSFWADMPRDARERIELPPLSLDAVGQLVRGSGRDVGGVYALTGGNPFHVTEFLTADNDNAVPRNVQDVTLARAARLSAIGRRTLEHASIFPRQIDEETLRRIDGGGDDGPAHAGVEECLASGMLNVRDGRLAFRHELARRAIHEALSPLRRRELHAAALALLKGRNDRRAAEIAHHAEQAGAPEDLVRFSIAAAQEAAPLGAYRETAAHLSRAIEHGVFLPESDRAQLLQRKAYAAFFCGAYDEAMTALGAASESYRRGGDVGGLGETLRTAGHVQWGLGDPDLAEASFDEAVRALQVQPGSWQYASALASQSLFDTLADRNDLAVQRARDALARAEALGRWDIYMRALTALRTAEASTDLDGGAAALRDAIAEGRRRGEADALPRLYANLTSVLSRGRRYEGLDALFDEGLTACSARDQAPLVALIRGNRASVLLDRGRLEDALTEAEDVIHGPYPKGAAALPSMIALSRTRVRLGLPEGGLLDQARRMPTVRRDLLWRAPVAMALAEVEWLDGEGDGVAAGELEAVLDGLCASWSQLWNIGEVALWLAILGRRPRLSARAAEQLGAPHRAYLEGRWRDAADGWAALCCPYEQAIALSDGDEDAQREGLALFDRLGAVPAARRLRRRMRAAGQRS